MSRLNYSIVAASLYVLVFLQSHAAGLPRLLGVQLDLTPGFLVGAAMRCSLSGIAVLALLGGLCLDALSANPFGTSVLPLFLAGWLVHAARDLLLRDSLAARSLLGATAGIAVPFLGWLLLTASGADIPGGWTLLHPLALLAIANALTTPLWFGFFARLDRTFNYATLPESAYRPDREIKRGRS